MRSRLLAFRRTAAIGAVWAVAMVGLVATSSSASGQEAVEPGTGNAYAQGFKINPKSGGLSFGITYGMALAGHQNKVAVGEARSVDLGVIGDTLAGESCSGGDPTLPEEDQPHPLVVRSTDDERSREETEHGVEKRARADDTPFAEAVAITAAAGDPAAVQVGKTTSRTVSGVVDGKRQAIAITEVADISFGGGAFVVKGLRWEAVHQSAPEESVAGSFSVEGIESAGEAIPVDDVGDGLAGLNEALRPLGFSINTPEVRNESGIVFVDPLKIGIVPSATRDGVAGPILGGVSPVREALVDALIGFDCSTASLITVADIVLGSVSGAGSLSLEVGGVTATSAELVQTSFLGSLSDFVPPTPLGDVPSGSIGGDGASNTGTSSGGGGSISETTGGSETVDTEPASTDGDEEVALPTEPLSGSRGGPLVGVGLGGLLLLAALAEGDRRKMRQAQRSVPMEVMA